ncbi:hypothetical protein D9M69_504330 [compost metagenome]
MKSGESWQAAPGFHPGYRTGPRAGQVGWVELRDTHRTMVMGIASLHPSYDAAFQTAGGQPCSPDEIRGVLAGRSRIPSGLQNWSTHPTRLACADSPSPLGEGSCKFTRYIPVNNSMTIQSCFQYETTKLPIKCHREDSTHTLRALLLPRNHQVSRVVQKSLFYI